VSAGLFSLPGHYNYRVLCAPLGSGQDRFLQALSDAGEQVLDLRSLAGHPAMASIAEGHRTQPTQAQFDGNLVDVLRKCDPERPVWTEAVGQTLGGLSLPKGLVDGMLHSQPVFLEVPMVARVRWWQESSSSIAHNPPAFVRGLAGLAAVVGAEKFGEWSSLAGRGRVDELLERILVHYIDPSYRRSILRNFADIAERGLTLRLRSLCAKDIQAVVEGVLDQPADDERDQAPSPLTMIAHTFTGS
jgi:tRNA 2-selenouridine synthase